MYRRSVKCDSKSTMHKLSDIRYVYAARLGLNKKDKDKMTYFQLILRMAKGQRIKILETRNATRIRKELMLLRKFLNHDNPDDPVIYDETRTENGEKQSQRNMDMPTEMQVINSSGERLIDDVFGDDDDD